MNPIDQASKSWNDNAAGGSTEVRPRRTERVKGGRSTAVRICLSLFSRFATGTPCSCVMDKDWGWEEGRLDSISVDFPSFSPLLSTCRTKSLMDHSNSCVALSR